jgi:hypothetical protein
MVAQQGFPSSMKLLARLDGSPVEIMEVVAVTDELLLPVLARVDILDHLHTVTFIKIKYFHYVNIIISK